MGQIKIINPGFLTTVQDLGRYGYQQYGVSVSGVMDQLSAKLANILVGNNEGEGLLEVTMMGPQIEFKSSILIAITGANMQPVINGNTINMNKSIIVNPGDKLSFKGLKNGCRSYIAFAGGIDVPIVMGSKSTFLRGKLGGFEGRALKAGDTLNIGQPSTSLYLLEGKETNENFYDMNNKTVELRVVLGPQDDAFTQKGLETFLSNEYHVTPNCDRMGYTLDGEKIEHKDKADIISDGISMGAIQVPSKGNPIIMMADRQTTGGYTKIGNVITSDLSKVAQAKPGDKIIFKKSSLQEAHALIKEIENKFEQIKFELSKQVKIEVLRTKKFNVRVNGNIYDVKVDEIK
ncbi:biotin-dependent carboxyltransferase family protein [Sedimentibacter sp. MB31-C6]|uniref:5-oxoprolinase subunit C family protein n=1 Tax=Sedimentibacter sp. MB31-C6 TaxID=3109366 RepID=UPI002DDD69D2|nr:biotin-dependent carboxyltransferase family protein [Sedimentibacter sp. MB36-C1]WSI04758.1 biotin-dependent carboxyltransferase family protein [Sedimentibacter sp. MB36-C1]